jgi:hypothetical protein
MSDTDTVNHNNQAVLRLQPGDRLVLRWWVKEKFWSLKWQLHEKSYEIGELLGQGNTTKVFALQNDPTRVLRLPKNWNVYHDGPSLIAKFITDWISGYNILWPKFKSIPEMYDSVPDLYIEAERVGNKGDPTLYDFLENPNQFTTLQRTQMLEALESFARKTADLIQIGDFRSAQLMYTRDRGWMLMDWSNGAYFRTDLELAEQFRVHTQSIFDQIYEKDKFYTGKYRTQGKWITLQFTEAEKAWYQKIRDILDSSVHDERWLRWKGVTMPSKTFFRRACTQAQAQAF